MHILIQHRHDENEISGILTYIKFIKNELEKNRIAVKIISTKQNSTWEWLAAIKWADIVHMNSNHLGFALLCKFLNKKIVIKYHYLFYQSTHFHYEPMEFSQRLKAEFIHSLPKCNYPLKWKIFTVVKWARLVIRIATASLADCHTACSNFLADSYAFHQPIYTLYNPIVIENNQAKKTLKNIFHPCCFVFVGRLNEDKGADILLRATQLLQKEGKDFRVLIIGDGTESEKLKQLASELDVLDCVKFLGKLSHHEVLQVVYSALALIAPSRWQDPAPYVVLEASSVQTCSIVSKMGGLPEVAGPSGFLFDNEDASSLAEAMRYCLEHPDEAIDRGLQAKQYVAENFSPEKAANQLLEICKELFYNTNEK